MQILKRAGIALVLVLGCLLLYVIIANRHSKNMTNRQKLLKAVYPVMMWFTKKTGTNIKVISNKGISPIVPVYSLPALLSNGTPLKLGTFRGKKILLVNTASDCGYTGQYAGLEQLYRQHSGQLVVLGFPANDFKSQEKATDKNIALFCQQNYGVTFPLMKKSSVVKGITQNVVFEWLSNKNKNGWNDQAPSWNFCKYLVDEEGRLTHYFAPSVDPMSKEVLRSIAE